MTSWTQFESLYGGFARGRRAAPVRLRLLRQRRKPRLHRPGAQHRAVRRAARRELPAADRSLGLPISVESLEPDAEPHPAGRDRRGRRRRDGPGPFTIDVARRRRGRRVATTTSPSAGTRNAATVINKTSTHVKVEVLLDRRRRPVEPARAAQARRCTRSRRPPPTPVPVTGRKFAGSESARTGINGLAVADDVTIVRGPGPGHRRHQGGRHPRPRPVEGRADRAHQPLRAERQPDGHPRRAARA